MIHNLLALCLRRQGRVLEAGRHLQSALVISSESGNQRNQALALANLGCLALDVGASWVAERFLVRSETNLGKVSPTDDRATQRCLFCSDNCFTRALQLFLELWESPTDEEHVQAYLWLGRSYKQRGRRHEIRACYEMGLLIALHARNLHSKYKFSKKCKKFRELFHQKSQDCLLSVH